jgi:hypothetical protein
MSRSNPDNGHFRVLAGAGPMGRELLLRETLERTGGNVAQAGRELGYGRPWRSGVWYHLRKLGLGGLPAQIREERRNRFTDMGGAA